MVQFKFSSVLRSYTNSKIVEVKSNNLLDAINQLDIKFPGIKFRFIDEHDKIRSTMRIYLNGVIVDDIDVSFQSDDEVFIVHVLSGG